MKKGLTVVTAVIGVSVVASCGDGGKWVEAPNTLSMYEGMDRARQMQEQVEENRAPSAESKSCSELLGQMRQHIEEAKSNNIMFQQMVRNCGDLGMQFGAEVRCEDGRLQVKCK